MVGTIQKCFLGASVLASVSAIASTPALAISIADSPLSLTRSTPGSLVGGIDYTIFKVVGNQTVEDNNLSLLPTILQGNCNTVVAGACSPVGSPGGNVELATFIDKGPTASFYANLNNFKDAPVVSLNGSLFGNSITLSSLDGNDWFTTAGGGYSTAYGTNNLANTWFNDILNANGFGGLSASQKILLYNSALNGGVFQRFSNPNPSYVNQDTSSSGVIIGLAGHLDATNLLLSQLTPAQQLVFLNQRSPDQVGKPIQASELIKVDYAGQSKYLFTFQANASGLTSADGTKSHTGNYQLDPLSPATQVPEPSTLLGIIGVGGFWAGKRKLMKKAII